MGFSFPKGNGIKIIKQESEAVANPSGGSIYILPLDEQFAKIIVVSKSGNKREIGGMNDMTLVIAEGIYENNHDAIAGGLTVGQIYRTEEGFLRIVF